MIKILDLYIAKIIFTSCALVLLILISMNSLFVFIEELKDIGTNDYDFFKAIIYTLLSLVKDIELYLPMVMLLGSLIGLGILANNSELVIMSASGMSKSDIVKSAIKSITPIIFLALALSEFLTPLSQKVAVSLKTKAMSSGTTIATNNQIWTKENNMFINIEHVLESNRLENIKIFLFDNEFALSSILVAKKAHFAENSWQLEDINKTQFQPNQIKSSKQKNMKINLNLSPDELEVVKIKAENLSIIGLYKYINYLKQNNQASLEYKLVFWQKLLYPLAIITMLLLALSFIFGPLREVTMSAKIIAGIITGFSYYVIGQILGPFSLVFNIAPFLGAFLPIGFFFLLAVYLLKKN